MPNSAGKASPIPLYPTVATKRIAALSARGAVLRRIAHFDTFVLVTVGTWQGIGAPSCPAASVRRAVLECARPISISLLRLRASNPPESTRIQCVELMTNRILRRNDTLSVMFVAQVSRTVAPTSVSSMSSRKRTVTTKAVSDVNLVVGGATFASPALGRFVFLPFHRSSLAKAGMPKQNGQTHLQAGDRLAEEVTFFTNTNDPAGFSLVDVFAWGALGHAAAFYILATSALAKSPLPF